MIHSLYGKRVRPTPGILAGIDTIVVDLQDIGTRFYTYMTTMAYMMEAAAKQNIKVMVLDRPNPINGLQIEGPNLDRKFIGFTGYFPMPIRHGLTMGELAQLFRGENNIPVELTVIKMKGWRRSYWFDETGLPWINPSPNMQNLIQATLYPGIGAIEGTRISVGRGTGTPFEQIGAPWIDGVFEVDVPVHAEAVPSFCSREDLRAFHLDLERLEVLAFRVPQHPLPELEVEYRVGALDGERPVERLQPDAERGPARQKAGLPVRHGLLELGLIPVLFFGPVF